MSVAQKLEQLVRVLPGVAGYQDQETSRDTDQALRQRLAGELERLKHSLEDDTRQLAERRALDLLPAPGPAVTI